ncbi:MAG: 3-hydroxybutyryl-CoA dehydrogenase [Frankiales bacterium]|nr:3-hydroxybutyryl-CoA dehydrogenase [Frankiales bacterium]
MSPESHTAAEPLRRVGVVGEGSGPQLLALVLSAGGADVRLVAPDALADLADRDLVVDASPEDPPAKAALLVAIADLVGPDAVIATVTLGLPVTALAEAVPTPSRVVGLRVTRLAPKATGLVEITRTVLTDPEVLARVETFARSLELPSTTVTDRPGALTAGLLLPYLNDAARMVEVQYATRDDVDAAMRFGCGYQVGPLQALDLLGLDHVVAGLDALHARTGDHLHAPTALLRQYVAAGRTGVDAGEGFYRYDEHGAVVPDPADLTGAGEAEPRPLRRIGVIGTGTMAVGIVEVLARAGYDVVFRARGADRVAAVQRALEASLDKAVGKGKLDPATRDEIVARVEGSSDLAALADCDLVLEAVVEDLLVKQQLFRDLDGLLKPGAVLATTTSSLPVIALAAVTSRPADVIGMHFFNPATIMKLVEVVPTIRTADDVLATVLHLTANIGKHAVRCGDRPGFIVNALLFPYLNDAVRAVEDQVGTLEQIDEAMVAATGSPVGPLGLIDVVGLDVTLAIQQTLHAASREPGHTPAASLSHLVTAGALGRKSGRGLRPYAKR